MEIKGWRYYNHAAVPAIPPHEYPDLMPIENGNIWKIRGGTPLLARWTTDFDCGYETNWWYVIKDTPFDISALKAKRRYEINKGKKNFEVKCIDPKDYVNDIFEIQVAAYANYPLKYRPTVDRENLQKKINEWNWYKVYAAFDIENGKMSGYALLNRNGNYIYFAVLKVDPQCESRAINAAIISHILEEHESFLENGGYISDGARNVQHETRFQDYLEKYFGFRKAYCKLHVSYRSGINLAVKILWPFRKLLRKFDEQKMIHQINGVLFMESIVRESEI